jgi:hypothetical protein
MPPLPERRYPHSHRRGPASAGGASCPDPAATHERWCERNARTATAFAPVAAAACVPLLFPTGNPNRGEARAVPTQFVPGGAVPSDVTARVFGGRACEEATRCLVYNAALPR